jgi:3-oxoacyl-[acyl-carrier-protein] synthase-1
MRRVVVTGIGIVSSIGNSADEVTAALRDARSGVVAAPASSIGRRWWIAAPPVS